MHTPVLLNEVLAYTTDVDPETILDATFGRGGHTRALLEKFPRAKIIAIDQDVAAIAHARDTFATALAEERLRVEHFNFHNIAQFSLTPAGGFDMILLDLGVSSPQLDEAGRGFSFYHDGPLDMRMNQTLGFTAADILNDWSEVQLLDLFTRYGEVRRPQRVVRAIVQDRKETPFAATLQFAQMIERIEGWHKKGHHPATRYFLALRMAVNNELSGLEECIPDLMRALSEKGRLIVITFHSLEDRIIKYAFKGTPELGYPLIKKVVVPSREETSVNPRARSAKLRVFQRGSAHESSAFK
jgi:16S rRNA (cytosine1402-N4)-methyltransferase